MEASWTRATRGEVASRHPRRTSKGAQTLRVPPLPLGRGLQMSGMIRACSGLLFRPVCQLTEQADGEPPRCDMTARGAVSASRGKPVAGRVLVRQFLVAILALPL